MIPIFVNREYELEILRRAIKNNLKVLIKGLRGIGKTTLIMKIINEYNGIYIDCMKILRPIHLRKIINQIFKINIEDQDPYNIIEKLFKIAEENNKPLALDEFTEIIKIFSKYYPYRGSGGISAIASHLRSLLVETKIPIILSSTSLKTIYELTKEYSKPLARAFDLILNINPLTIESSIELISKLASKYNIGISEKEKQTIALFTNGNPSYIKAIINILPSNIDEEKLKEILIREMREGYFNTLFTALINELNPSEIEVLYLISREIKRYHQIEKMTHGINLNLTLRELQARNLIYKKKIKRIAEYEITDKTFKTWLAMQEFPGLKSISYETLKITCFGFEALIRELFSNINIKITIKDELNKTLTINPIIKVTKYQGALGEINLIAYMENNEVIIGEIFFGRKCPPRKLDQLIKSIVIGEKLGLKIKMAILISYFNFTNKLIQKLYETEIKIPIYLISKKQLREICRKIGFREL